MVIDTKGWDDIRSTLKSQGWQGSTKQLQALMAQVEEASKLRHVQATWRWGERTRDFVFALVECAQKRGGSVLVTSVGSVTNDGPHILLSFQKGSRLQALQIQVKSDCVYLVRKFKNDWRSARNFYPREKSPSTTGEQAS